MEHVEHKEAAGRRKSPVTGGLHQALGRARSTQGVQSQPSTSGLEHDSPTSLPVIPSSGHQSPAHARHPAKATINPAPPPGYPQAFLSPDLLQQLSLSDQPTQLPGVNPSGAVIPPAPTPSMTQQLGITTPSFYNDHPHRAAPSLKPAANQHVAGPSGLGGGEHSLPSASGRVPFRGSLVGGHIPQANPTSQAGCSQTVAAVDSISASGTANGQDIESNTDDISTSVWPVRASRPVPTAGGLVPVSYEASYTAGGVAMTVPPAVTPLSSSFSQGYPQGLPSWLLQQPPDPRQEQRGQRPATLSSHISTPQMTYQIPDRSAGLSAAPQPEPQPHQLPHPTKASPFLTASQVPRSAQSSNPQTPSNVASLQPQRRIQQQPIGAAAAGAAAYAKGPMAQASWGGLAASLGERDPLRRSITTGRMSMPRVPSISEIEPVLESDDLRLRAGSLSSSNSSLLTRAIRIPSSQSSDRPRTYRVAPAKSQSSHDDVTVVLEGDDDGERLVGAVGSAPVGRSTYSAQGSHHSLGSSSGGAAALLSTSLRPSSLINASLFGGIFGSRQCVTPDSSVHGADALPFSGRDRFFSGGVTDPPMPPAFGSLPTSSLLRSRTTNISASSILNKATGGLKTPMKRATSYQQFSSPMDGSGSASRNGRLLHRSVNGGSDSSGAGTSTGMIAPGVSAAAGGGASSGGYGLGAWLRGAGAPGSTRTGAGGPGPDGPEGEVPAGGRREEPDLADLAVLASSLPASLGTWSLPRSVALASSPHGIAGSLPRTLSHADSIASLGGVGGGSIAGPSGCSPPAAAVGPAAYPICLICLEVLTPEDFEAGDAIALQCACKGEVALRHRKCAIEWSHHKGDVVCDICKQFISNLPPIPPEVLAAREAARRRRQPAFNTAAEPNLADYVFDCIRATWVTMIVCVLFFDLTVGQAFLAGTVVGIAFALMSAILAACARRARARLAARAVERAAAESRAQEQAQRGQRPPSRASGRASSSFTQPLLATAEEV